MDFDKLSRRSFIKKTTVLSVGAASVSLFSGLANASDYYYGSTAACNGRSPTSHCKVSNGLGGYIEVYECSGAGLKYCIQTSSGNYVSSAATSVCNNGIDGVDCFNP